LAALLSAQAFIEIRMLAGSNPVTREVSPTARLERIRFLANLCHNLPGVANPPKMQPVRKGLVSSRDRAMAERPMIWTWHVLGERPVDAGDGRALSLALAGRDDQGRPDLLDGLAERLAPQHGVQHVVSDDRGRPPYLPLRAAVSSPSSVDSRMFSRSLLSDRV